MKLTTTTTYIGKDGVIKEVKKRERTLYYDVVLSTVLQTAVIKEWEGGSKITVTRLEPDKIE